jgi:hypothetical protein
VPENSNNKWTPEEDARLKSLIEASVPTDLIAAKMKRTTKGVKSRAHVLGISTKRVSIGLKAKRNDASRRQPINRRPRALRRLRHPLPAAGKGGDRSRISRRAQGDGCGVAEAGGSIRRLSSERLRQMPRHDSEIAAGAFWVPGLSGADQR